MPARKFFKDAAWLREQYLDRERECKDIGNELNCCYRTVLYYLHAFGIPIRPTGGKDAHRKISERHKGNKYTLGYRHTEESKRKIGEAARGNKYNLGNKNALGHRLSEEVKRKIAEKNKGRPGARIVKHSEDGLRRIAEANRGANNHGWKGGSSFKPYCPKFNEKFRERIREKHKRICYLCPTTEADNGERLSVHHIDYNKNSICNGQEWSFVPLCHGHHTETNFNRWYWFNLLINYWAMNKEINFNSMVIYSDRIRR